VAGVSAYLHLGRNEDPEFTVKTMVVVTLWPGATQDETMQQVTDRIEKKLQDTPNLYYLKSYTVAGTSTVFVYLLESTPKKDVPDLWYQVRKKVGDIRQTLPQGIVGPFFNDEFGDTYGIIYGFTADGFSHRELRDYAEEARSRLLRVKDVSKAEFLGTQDERIYVELKGSATTRQPLLEAVLASVRTLEAERLVTLLSFDHEIIRSAKLISGGIRTAATFPARGRRLISTRSILQAAEHAGVDEVALHFGLASRRAVEAFHERGLSVAVWTVNSKLAMRRLVACGVDSIMTNFPNRLREILASSAQRPMSALSRRRQRNS